MLFLPVFGKWLQTYWNNIFTYIFNRSINSSCDCCFCDRFWWFLFFSSLFYFLFFFLCLFVFNWFFILFLRFCDVLLCEVANHHILKILKTSFVYAFTRYFLVIFFYQHLKYIVFSKKNNKKSFIFYDRLFVCFVLQLAAYMLFKSQAL